MSEVAPATNPLANISVVVPPAELAKGASILGQMIVINLVFSFSSDMVAQLLEGKRVFGETRKRTYKKKKSPPTSVKVGTPEPVVLDPITKEPIVVPAVTPEVVVPAPTTEPTDGKPGTPQPTPPTSPRLELMPDGKPYPEPFDWNRCFKFAFTGVIFCGVVQFMRLEFIDVIFPKNTHANFQMAIYKTLFNQLIFSPIVRVASMSTIQYMKTRDCEDVRLKLKADFFEAQAVSYAVKPVGNFLAFWLFPHELVGQAIMIRSIAFVYNVYFSYKANKEVHGDEALEAHVAEKKGFGSKDDMPAAEGEELKRERAVDGATDQSGGEQPTPAEGAAKKKAAAGQPCVCCVIS